MAAPVQSFSTGPALAVPLANPFGVQPAPDGSLVIASFDHHAIYRLAADRQTIARIAGTGSAGALGTSGASALEVQLNHPHEVQVLDNGDILVADTSNHRVGRISAKDGTWTTIVGTGQPGFAGDGGPASRAQLDQAYSIAVDGNNLWICDLGNHRIRHVDLETMLIGTVCGTGQRALPRDGAQAQGQPLAGPRSLAVDADNLWIVLREGNSVWRIDRASGHIFHVAGTGAQGMSGDGGPATEATLRGPKGIAVSPGDQKLYVADTENHAIRCVDLTTGRISTAINRQGIPGFNGDGPAVATRQLRRPHGVCVLPDGSLLIGDSENHRLRMAIP
ncbi:MAG: hypothetical protein KatS3mg111_1651 [Pirellulaceae bacterium]|nr:MAG: hypothetical protein KatS3mg111_1651 [Pirellulaceae bacterium]